MKVVKFGGSSLANGPQLEKVLNIMLADTDRKVLVVSAPGKRFKEDIKVTDLLKTYAQLTIVGEDTTDIQTQILQRYRDIVTYFELEENEILSSLSDQLAQLSRVHYPSFDYLYAAFMGHGEYLNAQLVAYVLRELGHPAQFVSPHDLGLTVSGSPMAARVNEDSYDRIATFNLPSEGLIVVPGFLAYTTDGLMATFSRGGSDITGAILARSFHADMYENFTDVSAIYAVDPHIIKSPAAIETMTYREMRELAYAGFAVFHDEAIIPVIEADIPINVKNTNEPDAPGTMIVPVDQFSNPAKVTGIASDDRFAALYLHRYLLNKEVGFTLRILQILARHGVSYEHMPSGIDDMTIIFDKTQLTQPIQDAICAEIQAEIAPDHLEWIDDFAIIMVVGEGMQNRVGAFSEIATPLSEAGITLPMINQGASQISLMLGVKASQVNDAVRVIYDAVF